jgi:2-oxo-4-hydroxy-4-carboxy-5-ureidoimidazoline decarboxylase
MTGSRGDTALDAFNRAPAEEVLPRLLSCLAVPRWAEEVTAGRPYPDRVAVLRRAASSGRGITPAELDAALARHPRIGERARPGEHDADFSRREQAGVHGDGDVAARLADGNRRYSDRFDRVFLIRAAGRSAEEILAELDRRLGNDDDTERRETIEQLVEIAQLRLDQVITETEAAWAP